MLQALWKLYFASLWRQETIYWWSVSVAEGISKEIYYLRNGHIPMRHRKLTNLVPVVGLVSSNASVSVTYFGRSCKNCVVRQEHDNMSWMKAIVKKFTKAALMVVDPRAAPFKTGKARMIIGCETDPVLQHFSSPSCRNIFNAQGSQHRVRHTRRLRSGELDA